jgi:L-lactate dehydrogenase
MSVIINPRKVAIIGCGMVGSSSAFALMQSGLFSEMVLVDVAKDRAEGEAMDISHGLPFVHPMKIWAGSYDDIADAQVIVVTAGAAQKPGETRLDLIKKNIGIFGSIMPEIKKRNCPGIMLVVSNPVDVLTYAAIKMSGMPEKRVFGSGTVLDTARLKYLLGDKLSVDARSVHAYIVGEHGDSEIVVWSSANISGVPINDFCALRGDINLAESEKQIADDVKNSAYVIIEKKKATYYGIAMSVRRICSAIVRDEKSVLPVSTIFHGSYGISDIALSIPSIVGLDGVESMVPITMSDRERDELAHSADVLKKMTEGLF